MHNSYKIDIIFNMSYIDYDYLFKILIIGDSGVGKSAILLRYLDDVFVDQYVTTIGVDFRIKTIEHRNKVIKLQIWDTAGQERFRTITSSYYRGATAAIVVFDLTDKESFQNVKFWLDEIDRYTNKPIKKIFIGTKFDDVNKIVVSGEDIKELEESHNAKCILASAKTGEGVNEAFDVIINEIIDFHVLTNDNKKQTPLKISDASKKDKKNKCCQ